MKRVIPIAWLLTAALLPAVHSVAVANGNGSHPESTVQLPAGAHTSDHIYGTLPGLSNVGRVAPGVYRGAQPAAEGYATLKKMGIRTVINLRTSMSEKTEVEAAGMRSIEVPMEMSTDNLKVKVDRVVSLMADPSNRPLFVHCRQGQDRTGIVVAAYRMKEEGWPLVAAEAEMEAFGFNDVWVNFKRFIRDYGAEQGKK